LKDSVWFCITIAFVLKSPSVHPWWLGLKLILKYKNKKPHLVILIWRNNRNMIRDIAATVGGKLYTTSAYIFLKGRGPRWYDQLVKDCRTVNDSSDQDVYWMQMSHHWPCCNLDILIVYLFKLLNYIFYTYNNYCVNSWRKQIDLTARIYHYTTKARKCCNIPISRLLTLLLKL